MSGALSAVIAATRTFLFVPANRLDRFDKAAAAGADVVILDLEDAVAPAEKQQARDHVRNWLCRGNTAMVRINAAQTEWYADDVRAIADCAAAIMVPKTEHPDHIRRVTASAPGVAIVPLVETAKGIAAVAEICSAPNVVRLAFGSIDLAVQLGVDSNDREALLFARSALVASSAAAGLAAPIDGATTAIHDIERTSEDTSHARRLGMLAKMCIHPAQVATVRAAYAPSGEDLAWARRILASAEGDHAVAVDGAMVDLPVVRRAQAILATGD
jgi:citrate lyase subunit beta / citryl-CoA lyase